MWQPLESFLALPQLFSSQDCTKLLPLQPRCWPQRGFCSLDLNSRPSQDSLAFQCPPSTPQQWPGMLDLHLCEQAGPCVTGTHILQSSLTSFGPCRLLADQGHHSHMVALLCTALSPWGVCPGLQLLQDPLLQELPHSDPLLGGSPFSRMIAAIYLHFPI